MMLLCAVTMLVTGIQAQKQDTKKTVATPAVAADPFNILFSKLKYRLAGPFRGGRSAAVAGSFKNKTTFYFGATTPSFDLETDIDQVYDTEHINNDQIIKTINTFKGEIVQELSLIHI